MDSPGQSAIDIKEFGSRILPSSPSEKPAKSPMPRVNRARDLCACKPSYSDVSQTIGRDKRDTARSLYHRTDIFFPAIESSLLTLGQLYSIGEVKNNQRSQRAEVSVPTEDGSFVRREYLPVIERC